MSFAAHVSLSLFAVCSMQACTGENLVMLDLSGRNAHSTSLGHLQHYCSLHPKGRLGLDDLVADTVLRNSPGSEGDLPNSQAWPFFSTEFAFRPPTCPHLLLTHCPPPPTLQVEHPTEAYRRLLGYLTACRQDLVPEAMACCAAAGLLGHGSKPRVLHGFEVSPHVARLVLPSSWHVSPRPRCCQSASGRMSWRRLQ